MSDAQYHDEEYVSLQTIGQGAAVELFNDELKRVLENMLDPNTAATTVRTIQLTVSFKPTEERDMAAVNIEVKSKQASPKGVGTFVYCGRQHGQAVAMERNPRQPVLPLDNVTEIGGRN